MRTFTKPRARLQSSQYNDRFFLFPYHLLSIVRDLFGVFKQIFCMHICCTHNRPASCCCCCCCESNEVFVSKSFFIHNNQCDLLLWCYFLFFSVFFFFFLFLSFHFFCLHVFRTVFLRINRSNTILNKLDCVHLNNALPYSLNKVAIKSNVRALLKSVSNYVCSLASHS